MTISNSCHNLDDYLNGELAPGEAARFSDHLDECPTCREAVDQQQWIDGLLRAPAIAQLEPPSPALVTSVRAARARRLQISRIAIGITVAAAATLLVGAGWVVELSRQTDRMNSQIATNHVDAPVAEASVATFVGGPEVIVVPVESADSDVTIVRVYPVLEPDYSAQASWDQAVIADEFSRPDLNGG
jgi:anti-sigma factor RsiW